jgi:hypothetical protein
MMRFTILLLVPLALLAQEKKPAPNDAPKILLSNPLGVPVGKTTKVTLRGMKLDTTKELKLPAKISGKILNKGGANVPNMQEPNIVGNTQVELEVTLANDFAGDALELSVVTNSGQSNGHRLLVDRTAVIAEKEPNDGFKQAQTVKLGEVIQGTIERPKDVDVFRVEVKAGQRIVFEIHAHRHGSALDSYLTLHDEEGRVLTTDDDAVGRDSRIEHTFAKAGHAFLSVIDAHDQGGPAYPYRLLIKEK